MQNVKTLHLIRSATYAVFNWKIVFERKVLEEMPDHENRRICGYMLLRTPGEETLTGEHSVLTRPLDWKTIFYHGIDRNPWCDFDMAYFEDKLPNSLAEIWHKKNDLILAQHWPETLADYADVTAVQDHFKDSGVTNEVIGIYSSTLEQTQGSFTSDKTIVWLGYDLVPYGEFSLILAGIFRAPEHFSTFYASINEYGLFDNKEAANGYADLYCSLAEDGICDEYAMPLEYLRIGRVSG